MNTCRLGTRRTSSESATVPRVRSLHSVPSEMARSSSSRVIEPSPSTSIASKALRRAASGRVEGHSSPNPPSESHIISPGRSLLRGVEPAPDKGESRFVVRAHDAQKGDDRLEVRFDFEADSVGLMKRWVQLIADGGGW